MEMLHFPFYYFNVSCILSFRRSQHTDTGGLTSFNILHFVLPAFPALAHVATALALESITTAVLLIHMHQSFINPSPDHVCDYVASMISPTFGFQLTALVFSLPLSVLVYSCIIFTVQLSFLHGSS